jgi:SAM-dependent methyltransferase
MTRDPEFDEHAEDYDTALAQGIAISGEDKNYFAQGRVAWLSNHLQKQQHKVRSIMDFGCGTGSSTPFFFELLGVDRVLGVDVSPRSLQVARRNHESTNAQFLLHDQYQPNGQIDVAFCNGVFHHIPLAERTEAINYIYRSLRPGGLLALWENNPWNPGTRYVMSRCPFDDSAITLTPPETRHLLRDGGFEVLRTDFLFIFPRALSKLRGIEPLVARWPLGTQYQVLARKP